MEKKETRGGKRKGAGRKSLLSGDATVVKRVPNSLVETIDKMINDLKQSGKRVPLPLEAMFPVERPHRILIPFALDKIPAGFPSPAEGYIEKYIDLNEFLIHNKTATFIVRAGGDSMQDAGIDKEDILLIDRSIKARHGDIVMADLGNEFTIKRLALTPEFALQPENSRANYPVLIPHETDTWTIVGVVTSIIKVLRRD